MAPAARPRKHGREPAGGIVKSKSAISINNLNQQSQSAIDTLNRPSTLAKSATAIQQSAIMITVYGADWCEDTRRSLRHLRRLAVPHQYVNIDEDFEALERAKALNHGERRTPVIDLGFGGPALVEPDNDLLTGAVVEGDMLSNEVATERLAVQNVGDFERVLRTALAGALLLVSRFGPSSLKRAAGVAGAVVGFSGVTGWCPLYHAAGVTSMDGPGDRPDEATRAGWLAPRTSRGSAPAGSLDQSGHQ
jgi:glutaredoxin